jgi:hypothetical protein
MTAKAFSARPALEGPGKKLTAEYAESGERRQSNN